MKDVKAINPSTEYIEKKKKAKPTTWEISKTNIIHEVEWQRNNGKSNFLCLKNLSSGMLCFKSKNMLTYIYT